jgi:hypothetical protein
VIPGRVVQVKQKKEKLNAKHVRMGFFHFALGELALTLVPSKDDQHYYLSMDEDKLSG